MSLSKISKGNDEMSPPVTPEPTPSTDIEVISNLEVPSNVEVPVAESPSGLDWLVPLAKLHIKQESSINFATFCLYNDCGPREYSVSDGTGDTEIVRVREATNRCFRCLMENCLWRTGQMLVQHARPFTFVMGDIIFNRPCWCCNPYLFCHRETLNTYQRSEYGDHLIGSVREPWIICPWLWTTFTIRRGQTRKVLRITGPLFSTQACVCLACCRKKDFRIWDKKWNRVGGIEKNSDGVYVVTFPKDLDVNVKAVIIGTVIELDFLFSEKTCRRLDKEVMGKAKTKLRTSWEERKEKEVKKLKDALINSVKPNIKDRSD